MFLLRIQVSLILALLPLAVSETRKGCHKGWTSFGSGCYKIGDTGLTHEEAQDFCHAFDATPVEILDDETMKFTQDLLDGSDLESAWIGATLFYGDWVWDYETDYVDESFFADPDSGDTENSCGALSRDQNWHITKEKCDDRRETRAVVCFQYWEWQSCANGTCYELLPDDYTYAPTGHGFSLDRAAEQCALFDGHVLEINSAEEKKTVLDFVTTASSYVSIIWLGVTDESSEGKFYHRSDNSKVTFTDWAAKNPARGKNRHNKDCAVMDQYYGWKWENVYCTGSNEVICERPE